MDMSEPQDDDPWALDTGEEEVEPLEDRMWDEIFVSRDDNGVFTSFVTTDSVATVYANFIPPDSSPPF